MEKLLILRNIKGSPEVTKLLTQTNQLELAPGVNGRMEPLLRHLQTKIGSTMEAINSSGRSVFIAGPDWCRENSDKAGTAHARVIVDAYGSSYALPNKNPDANKTAIDDGQLDMFLMFDEREKKPIGTACMVMNSGWAELGRAASLGRVGNSLIQDLRIIHWLTDEKLSKKFHSLFATLRTAPDRNIGTPEKSEIMRGGQAISHIWANMPEVKVAGFGPLYKKHGELEQFAFAFITREELSVPGNLWIENGIDLQFVKAWLKHYGLKPVTNNPGIEKESGFSFKVDFPPKESGITEFVHGEINLTEGQGMPLWKAISTLETAQVPFIQFPVPVDLDTRQLQQKLSRERFVAFQFTPGIAGVEGPKLWFGRNPVRLENHIVPTFWQKDKEGRNPFWNKELAAHADRIFESLQFKIEMIRDG